MKSPIKRTHIVIPEELALQIDAVAGKRGRARFVTDAVSQQLKQYRQLKALRETTGAWRDEDHPELAQGAERFVRTLREEDEARFQSLGHQE